MGPYSHFIIAAKLEKYLQPDDPKEYYWGAIIPDIRYLAKTRRSHTHLRQEQIKELAACYPHLGSFLLGYRVHCLIDEIDVAEKISKAFPLNLLKKMLNKVSRQQMTMLVEMYYLQTAAAACALSGSHNEVLRDLAITPEQTSLFFNEMQEYIRLHSFDAVISAFQKIGLIENERLERYIQAYESMKRNRLMIAFFLLCVKSSGLEAYTLNHVRAGIPIAHIERSSSSR